MKRRGVSLALNTVGIAILVLVVVVVLGWIFFGYAAKLVGIEDECGKGLYSEYYCTDERPEDGFVHCFVTSHSVCTEVDEDVQPLCCRR